MLKMQEIRAFFVLSYSYACAVSIPGPALDSAFAQARDKTTRVRIVPGNGTAVQPLLGAARQLRFISHGGGRSHGGDVVGLVGSDVVAGCGTAVDGVNRSVGVGGLHEVANCGRDFFRFGEAAQRYRTLVELHLFV